MAWTPDTFYSEFCKQLQKCLLGEHSYVHKISLQDLRKRFSDKKTSVSSFIISDDELLEKMRITAKECAEDAATWLNLPIKRKSDFTFELEYAFENKIANIITNLNGLVIETQCSDLYIILTKTQTKDGGFTFKITTEYCELTPYEEMLEKTKRDLL